MPPLLTNGSLLQCSFGMAPSPLTILPLKRVMAGKQPVAAITDFVPTMNIATFGSCMSMANPTVLSATIAAFGVLTPMPCIPATVAPWTPGAPTVMTGGIPAATTASTCMCAYGGVISVTMPAQMTAMTS